MFVQRVTPAAIAIPEEMPARPPALPVAWQCDLADDRLTWTPGVFDLFGFDRAIRPQRRAVLAHFEPDSRALLEDLRSATIATGGSFTVEAAIRRPDGARRWIRIHADTLCREGRAVLLYGSKLDISDEMPG